jgi:hypothetical protein
MGFESFEREDAIKVEIASISLKQNVSDVKHIHSAHHDGEYVSGCYTVCYKPALVESSSKLRQTFADMEPMYSVGSPLTSTSRSKTGVPVVRFENGRETQMEVCNDGIRSERFLVAKVLYEVKGRDTGFHDIGAVVYRIEVTDRPRESKAPIMLRDRLQLPNFEGKDIITTLASPVCHGTVEIGVKHTHSSQLCFTPVTWDDSKLYSCGRKLLADLEGFYKLGKSQMCVYQDLYRNSSPEVKGCTLEHYCAWQLSPIQCQIDKQCLSNIVNIGTQFHKLSKSTFLDLDDAHMLAVLASCCRHVGVAFKYGTDLTMSAQTTECFTNTFELLHWTQNHLASRVADCEDTGYCTLKVLSAFQNYSNGFGDTETDCVMKKLCDLSRCLMPVAITCSVIGASVHDGLGYTANKDASNQTHTTGIALNRRSLETLLQRGNKCTSLLQSNCQFVTTSIDDLDLTETQCAQGVADIDGQCFASLFEGTGYIVTGNTGEVAPADFRTQTVLDQYLCGLPSHASTHKSNVDFSCVTDIHDINFYKYATVATINSSKLFFVNCDTGVIGVKFTSLFDIANQNIGLVRLLSRHTPAEHACMAEKMAVMYPSIPLSYQGSLQASGDLVSTESREQTDSLPTDNACSFAILRESIECTNPIYSLQTGKFSSAHHSVLQDSSAPVQIHMLPISDYFTTTMLAINRI